MSELFRMRYPGRTPMDVLLEYIETHPGCTRNQMRRELASISHESYLRKLVNEGRVRKYGSKPQRYEVIRWPNGRFGEYDSETWKKYEEDCNGIRTV